MKALCVGTALHQAIECRVGGPWDAARQASAWRWGAHQGVRSVGCLPDYVVGTGGLSSTGALWADDGLLPLLARRTFVARDSAVCAHDPKAWVVVRPGGPFSHAVTMSLYGAGRVSLEALRVTTAMYKGVMAMLGAMLAVVAGLLTHSAKASAPENPSTMQRTGPMTRSRRPRPRELELTPVCRRPTPLVTSNPRASRYGANIPPCALGSDGRAVTHDPDADGAASKALHFFTEPFIIARAHAKLDSARDATGTLAHFIEQNGAWSKCRALDVLDLPLRRAHRLVASAIASTQSAYCGQEARALIKLQATSLRRHLQTEAVRLAREALDGLVPDTVAYVDAFDETSATPRQRSNFETLIPEVLRNIDIIRTYLSTMAPLAGPSAGEHATLQRRCESFDAQTRQVYESVLARW